MNDFFEAVVTRFPEIAFRTGEHILLTGISTILAVSIGVPLGILCFRKQSLRGMVMGWVGILQTVPSLAMLAILLALMGKIGTVPALVALTLYALLPIVRNTLTGLEGVDPEVKEAAKGMGLSPSQQLRWVELPLAEPVILAGIRTAAVVGVGIATLSAFIGAGGLGQFINRGLALSNTTLILLGAIPAAVLALLVDFSLAGWTWARTPLPSSQRHKFHRAIRPMVMASPILIVVLGIAGYGVGKGLPFSLSSSGPEETVRIGSKNFTEQIILGEIMAQLIEEQTDLQVERHFNLGGTLICHEGLKNGEIDVYAEYTGTALTAILGLEAMRDSSEVLEEVRRRYRKRFNCEWLKPGGFNNTYAITVLKERAQDEGWTEISDLADSAVNLRAGFTSEFVERPDGYFGLKNAYRFEFGSVQDLDPSIMYQALSKGEVDVICAFATDGRIPAYGLMPLEDNLGFFPPYEAAPVVRRTVLEAHPEIAEVLNQLGGKFDDLTMQGLNYAVDEEKRSPGEVAARFLEEEGFRD